jgi:hypothetical protein
VAPPVAGGRTRRVVIRTVLVLAIGGVVLAPILYYASTVDVRPPQVDRFLLSQHLPGDDGVALTTSSLEVVFSEAVNHQSAQSAFTVTPQVAGSFSWSGVTMIFTPADRLPLQTSFAVRLRGKVADLAGNVMSSAGPYAFQTVGGPSIVATQPADQAVDVALDSRIQLTFSTLMDTASVQRALEIVPSTAANLRWAGQRLTIVPGTQWLPDQAYTLFLGSGAHDQAGTALSVPLRLSFRTVSAGLTARTIVPAPDTQGIAVTTPIAVIFDRPIDSQTVDDTVVTISPAVSGSVSITAPEGAAGLRDEAQRILRFTPSGSLPVNTTFTVTVRSAIRGTDGSRMAAPLSWTFTTGAPSTSLGNQVVFLSGRSGIANVWAMNPDGSNQHEVSSELSPLTSYAVAPDGRSLVIGDGARLIELRADGSGRRVLTDAGLVEFDPTYAPDGSAIVFARADAKTGSGLGIWRRPPGGGGPERIQISPIPTPTPAPSELASPSASPGASLAPVLRAPRFSPDGSRLAFVDLSGYAGILDLRSGAVTRAPYRVVAPPAWLPDNATVLLSGLPVAQAPSGSGTGSAGQQPGLLTPGAVVEPLSPSGLHLTVAERSSLRIGELAAGGDAIHDTSLRDGGTLPEVDGDGHVAYLVLDPRLPDGGRLWITSSPLLPNLGAPASTPVVPDTHALESSVSFTPQTLWLVVAREPLPVSSPAATPAASPSPTATANPSSVPEPTPQVVTFGPGGIWVLNLVGGTNSQLSPDGWLPSWIP